MYGSKSGGGNALVWTPGSELTERGAEVTLTGSVFFLRNSGGGDDDNDVDGIAALAARLPPSVVAALAAGVASAAAAAGGPRGGRGGGSGSGSVDRGAAQSGEPPLPPLSWGLRDLPVPPVSLAGTLREVSEEEEEKAARGGSNAEGRNGSSFSARAVTLAFLEASSGHGAAISRAAAEAMLGGEEENEASQGGSSADGLAAWRFGDARVGAPHDPFLVGANAYVRISFTATGCSLSGLDIAAAAVSVRPAAPLHVHVRREVRAWEYYVWNARASGRWGGGPPPAE